jgi:hypothetical protein
MKHSDVIEMRDMRQAKGNIEYVVDVKWFFRND